MSQISYFNRVTASSDKEINISDAYKLIGNGKLRDITQRVKSETDKKKRNKLKVSKLPAVTVSGTFANGSQKISDFVKHSGLMQIDIDEIDNPEAIKEQLKKDNYTNCCFISPSGNGVKVIVKIKADIHTHLQTFKSLQKYYFEKYNIEIDEKCKDISRLMFLCSDSRIFINDKSETYTVKEKELKIKPITNTQVIQQFENDTLADTEKVISQITTQGIDITAGYNNWLSIGFALADEFGSSGRSYFHSVSRFNTDYDSQKADIQFDKCMKNGKNNGISPFFALAKQHGLDISPVYQNTFPVKKTLSKKSISKNEVSILEKPIEQSSKDPTKDFKDFEFYKQKGCYYIKKMVGKHLKSFRISNFLIESLYNLDNGTNNSKRIIKLQNRNGKINLIEVQSSETKLDSFETILKTHSCTFKGRSDDLKSIFEYLMDREKKAKEITTLGFQPESEMYAFADAVVDKNNELKKINELGIVENEKDLYYLPAFAPANVSNDLYESERLLAYRAGNLNFKTWADLFYKAYGLNGSIGIMYSILALFRDIVFKELRFFPFLFLFGDYGTGKTKYTNSILRMLGNFEGTDVNQTTDTGLSRTVSQRVNSLFYFKEFSNQTDKKIYNFILTAYDGVGKTMGQKTVGNQTKNLLTKSGIIFDGNYLPIHKAAVYSRLIVLNFEKQTFSKTETEAFDVLKAQSQFGFSEVAKEILKNREYLKSNLSAKLEQNLQKINQNRELDNLPARLKDHLALLVIPFQLLSDKLNFPFSLKDLQNQLIKNAKEQVEVLNEIKDITVFWQAMEYAKNTTFKLTDKFYLTEIMAENQGYIYIKYNSVFPFYVEYCKSNNYNISDKESLRNLLTSPANESFKPGATRKTFTKRPLGTVYR